VAFVCGSVFFYWLSAPRGLVQAESANPRGYRRKRKETKRWLCHKQYKREPRKNEGRAFEKPGIDVSANVTVTDADSKLIYSKGYRGESRTVANTWGRVINHACEDLAKQIAEDDSLVRVLATGKP